MVEFHQQQWLEGSFSDAAFVTLSGSDVTARVKEPFFGTLERCSYSTNHGNATTCTPEITMISERLFYPAGYLAICAFIPR